MLASVLFCGAEDRKRGKSKRSLPKQHGTHPPAHRPLLGAHLEDQCIPWVGGWAGGWGRRGGWAGGWGRRGGWEGGWGRRGGWEGGWGRRGGWAAGGVAGRVAGERTSRPGGCCGVEDAEGPPPDMEAKFFIDCADCWPTCCSARQR